MIAFPHCKINLGLNVVRKREDGYHDIATCFYPIPLTDILEIIPSAEFSFTTSGSAIPGNTSDNLCVKAFQLLKKDHRFGNVSIHLHKTVPMGAGLGGGSSDAVFTLRLLNDVFDLRLTTETLQEKAALLGSDCSFFVQDHPSAGHGRGDKLARIDVDLKGYFLILVKPPVHVSTASAYAGIVPSAPKILPEEILKNEPVENWKHVLKNDFEETVFLSHPNIKPAKDLLYGHGALYASMSGSGSAVFGLFKNAVDLRSVFSSDHFYWSGFL
jgi:4-diphosphocytidyl-2-C-methyl-D-erythritol kinase